MAQGRIAELEAQVSKTDRAASTASSTQFKLQTRLEASQAELAALRQQLTEVEEDRDRSRAELQAKATASSKASSKEAASAEALKKEVAALKKERAQAQAKTAAVEKELAKAKAVAKEVLQQNEELSVRLFTNPSCDCLLSLFLIARTGRHTSASVHNTVDVCNQSRISGSRPASFRSQRVSPRDCYNSRLSVDNIALA